MTFLEYVHKRKVNETPAGDFTYDVQRDARFTEDIRSWEALKSYVTYRSHGDRGIVDAGREVWNGYRSYTKRHAGFYPH